MTLAREPIYAALFARAIQAPGLLTTSRKLLHWDDVPATQRPALFQAQGRQIVERTAANGLPSKWRLDAKLYLYVSTLGAASPGEVLNPIMDALTDMFEPNAIGTTQTLGGLVQWARVVDVETSEGTLGDTEVAILSVQMLTA